MRLRAAVVGVGYLGKFHAQKYKTLADGALKGSLEFLGVCDLDSTRAKQIANELGVASFLRPQDLIGKVEAVTIATITSTHYELAKFFLENGVHVNIEKPITNSAEEATRLIELAQQKKLKLAVGQSERFNPVFIELKKRLEKPQFIEIVRQAPFGGRAGDVSVVHDLMIHDLDLIFQISPEWKLISAIGGRYLGPTIDWAQAKFSSPTGCQAQLTVSRMTSEVQRWMRVYDLNSVIEANFNASELKIMRSNGVTQAIETKSEVVQKADHLLLENQEFIKAILENRECQITGQHGRRALQGVEDVLQLIGIKK